MRRGLGAVRGLLEYRGVTPGPGATSTGDLLLRRARHDFPPMGLLVNETMSGRCRSANLGPACSPTPTPRWPTGPRPRWSRWAAPPDRRLRRPASCRAVCTPSSGAFPGCGRASILTAPRSTREAHPAPGLSVPAVRAAARRPAPAVRASSSCSPAATAARRTPAPTPTTSGTPRVPVAGARRAVPVGLGPVDGACRRSTCSWRSRQSGQCRTRPNSTWSPGGLNPKEPGDEPLAPVQLRHRVRRGGQQDGRR